MAAYSIPRTTVRRAALCLALGTSFALCVLFSLIHTRGAAGVASIWLANGVLAAAALLLPLRWTAGLAGACLVFNYLVGVALGNGWGLGLVFPVLNQVEAFGAAWLANKSLGATVRLTDLRRVARLVVFAICPATAATGVVAADVMTIFGRSFNEVLIAWFFGHTLGMAIALPALLLVLRRGGGWPKAAAFAGLGATIPASMLAGTGRLAEFGCELAPGDCARATLLVVAAFFMAALTLGMTASGAARRARLRRRRGGLALGNRPGRLGTAALTP